ncbi:MAG: hypothetical protein HC833_21580, partial [Leptolyngbyaceae cyanobacterium RM1_406_9]|nr:hypothetical protein [Leptolyngbyaceae cyanobacterium RM1_406_9]
MLRYLTALILELQNLLMGDRFHLSASSDRTNGLVRMAAKPVGKAAGLPQLRRFFSPDLLAPVGVGLLVLAFWEVAVRVSGIQPYLLPGPLLVLQT